MNIERAVKVISRARQATADPNLHEVLKVLVEMVHEISIARSEAALLALRVEELEAR